MTEKEFEKYYHLYAQELYGLAYTYTCNKQDSEDVLQNVLIKLIGVKKKFKSDNDLKYWLIRVTINECIDLLRYRKRRHEVMDNDLVYTVKENNDNDNLDLIFHLSNLPKKYKSVIILFYYYNYSTKEIAKLLKIGEENVRKLLERGRQLLKERMGNK